MTLETIIKLCDSIRRSVAEGNLVTPLRRLELYADKTSDPRLADRLRRIHDNYRYMLKFMMDGSIDSSRSSMLGDIKDEILTITDRIERDTIARDSSDIFSETLRNLPLSKRTLRETLSLVRNISANILLIRSAGGNDASLQKALEENLSLAFNHVWTESGSSEFQKLVSNAILSDDTGDQAAVLLINALILSLSGDFDRYKFAILLDVMEAEKSETLTARAMVGIMLALARHSDRVSGIPSLISRLEMLQDSLMAYRRLREILMAIIRTRDTDRVTDKMNREVIPEIMKLQPDMIRKMREAGDDIEAALEDNPEWQEMLENSSLGEKMREINDMQEDGSDLMMVAFSPLKQYPFFTPVSNWFLPFDINHSAITLSDEEKGMIRQMLEFNKGICHSDAFSLALSLTKMPENQRQMMTSQMAQQFEAHAEEIEKTLRKSSSAEFDLETTRTLREIYRFVKLFRKKEGVDNPFRNAIPFQSLPVVGEMLSDSEIISIVAEFYLKHQYYSEALPLLQILHDETPEDASVLEKIGYCYQRLNRPEKALEAFSKAELTGNTSKWLIRRLAMTYWQTKDFEKALEYYIKALENDPENRQLILRAGAAALHAGRYDEALKYYHHADYLKGNDPAVTRAIAWTQLLKGDYSKSETQYEKILSSGPTSSDWLNAGHLFLVEGKMKEAMKYYKEAIGDNLDDFIVSFNGDSRILEERGISKADRELILDWLRESHGPASKP